MIRRPRGTNDVLPAEQPLWQRVADTAAELCEAYGYGRVSTPVFEDTELFARTSGQGSDVVQKEMYTFEDRAGRSLTLRPEGTAAVARAYLEHGLHREPQPVKTYTVAPMYRYAAPQKGRYREFWQVSIEAMGADDPALDAETIQLADELLRRLDVGGYRLLLNSIGDRACRPAYVERLCAWLDEHVADLDEEAREKRRTSPLRVFDTKSPHVQVALAAAPTIGESLCPACREHFEAVRAALEAYGVRYELAPTLVRGLDYYTRTTFEFVGEALGAQSTICGGGRYDYLIEDIGGPPTPAVGWALGVERVLLSLRERGVEAPQPGVDVYFACEDEEARREVLPLLAELRRRGLRCDMDYAGRSLKGQLSHAKRLGARRTVVASGASGRVREPGHADWDVSLVPDEQVVERLAS